LSRRAGWIARPAWRRRRDLRLLAIAAIIA
jgi:hypothetical protein